MVDLPGRSAYQPEDRADRPEEGAEAGDGGWGSPVPAEYGSLHSVRPPGRETSPESAPTGGGMLSAWARSAGVRRVPDPEPGPHPERPPRAYTANPAPAGAAPREAVADRRPGPAPREAVADRRPGPAAAARPGPVQDSAGTQLPLRPVRGPGAERPERTDRRDPDATMSGVPTAGSAAPGDAATGSMPAVGLGAPPHEIWARPEPSEATVALPATNVDDDSVADEDTRAGRTRAGMPLRPARRPGRVRSRVVIRHLDVSTVAKVSLIFYLLVLIIVVVASVILWEAANSFGTLPSIQKSVRTLFSLRSFQIHVSAVAMYTAAAGSVIAVVGTIANILLAMIYNLIADVVGGIRVELESFGRD